MNKMISRSESVFFAIFLPRLARETNCGKYSPFKFSVLSRVSRAMVFCLSLFFATVSVFAESYPNRPTAGEMDEIVELGTECMLGVNERCWATQYATNPVSYDVTPPFVKTNDAGWYLDQNAMGTMASTITSLVPYYVDPDTVYEGMTNIVMLTVTGVWASLGPGRIYVTDLQERYQAVWAQKQTTSVVSHTIGGSYYGHGVGSNYGDAYNAAVASYVLQANPPVTEVQQHCKIAKWEDYVVQGGGGLTNESGSPPGTETHPVYHGGWIKTDLIVSAVLTGKITVASSGVTAEVIYTITTNAIVSGGIPSVVTGTYEDQGEYGGRREWEESGLVGMVTHYLSPPPGNSRLQYGAWVWELASGVEGDYDPALITGATGVANVALSVVETWTTNSVNPVDYSGDYFPLTNGMWQGDAGYIFITNGLYTIYGTSHLFYTKAYLTHNTLTGYYDAVNFVATTLVSEVSTGTPSCVGTYIGEEPTWTMGSWSCTSYGGSWYISQDTGSPPSPAWVKAGEHPAGTYAASGAGIYGSVYVATNAVYENYWTDEPTYYTNNAVVDGVSTTKFYECWLRKVAPSKTESFLTTNIEHRARFWVQPEKPTYGTTNIFNKEGLGLFKDVWNANAVDDWTAWSFSTPAAIENYWTTEMRTPPVIVSVIPTNANTTVCEGFEALNWLGIAEWRFQYCTNK